MSPDDWKVHEDYFDEARARYARDKDDEALNVALDAALNLVSKMVSHQIEWFVGNRIIMISSSLWFNDKDNDLQELRDLLAEHGATEVTYAEWEDECWLMLVENISWNDAQYVCEVSRAHLGIDKRIRERAIEYRRVRSGWYGQPAADN